MSNVRFSSPGWTYGPIFFIFLLLLNSIDHIASFLLRMSIPTRIVGATEILLVFVSMTGMALSAYRIFRRRNRDA
jgi:hypothetical protein